ncbi:hypothetical protein ACLB2K_009835 [Fragaria x ananassa]
MTDTFPPGCRFHPSEEQLLSYYLLSKKAYPAIPGAYDWIGELHDLRRLEPSELQNWSWYSYDYKGRKRHWYFYMAGVWEEEKKTKQGYWKRSGKVRDVFNRQGVVLGTKTSFVYYEGSPDTASRTDWVLYRYALANHIEGSFVICRVFSRSDSDFNSCDDNNAGVVTPEPVSTTSNQEASHYIGTALPPTPPVGSKPCSQRVDLSHLTTLLVNLAPEERRNMLGERLFPLVDMLETDKAPKVTGMLLELDNPEVLHLLESPEALKAKVAEAMDVLAKAAVDRVQ